MPMKPRRLLNVAIEYEAGFLRALYRDIRKNKLLYWKAIGLLIVLSGTLSSLLVASFSGEEFGSAYGIYAATLALGAAAVVFINMISTAEVARPRFDNLVRFLGGVLAFAAGVFWLLEETSGNILPYVVAVGLTGAVMLTCMLLGFSLVTVNRVEGGYLQQRRDAP